jgi:hypothetical protein
MNNTKERSHNILTVVSDHFLAHIWYEVMVFRGHSSVYEHYHGALLTAILGVRQRSCGRVKGMGRVLSDECLRRRNNEILRKVDGE